MFFGLCYSLSCLTKLFNDFNILLAGRILAGISTSLLFSAFEAWMVFEHFKVRAALTATPSLHLWRLSSACVYGKPPKVGQTR
jgi:hypothetical protein